MLELLDMHIDIYKRYCFHKSIISN